MKPTDNSAISAVVKFIYALVFVFFTLLSIQQQQTILNETMDFHC